MPVAARGAGRGSAPRPLPGSHCRMRADPGLACSPAPSLAPDGRLGFPLTRARRLRQPRVEGRGKKYGVGLGRERRKEEGGGCGSPWPEAQLRVTCRQGHCHDPPPPPATPKQGMGRGRSPGTDIHP